MAMDAITGDEFAVGCCLAIKTTLGDEFQGQIITFDRPSNILVLPQEGTKAGSQRNIRLLKASYIKEFSLLEQAEDPLNLNKCHLDLNIIQAREQSAIRQAELDSERLGVGVTSEAQGIFDALSKTLPVRWDKTSIVVMNEVRVTSPYLPENVIGGTGAANERVKKVEEVASWRSWPMITPCDRVLRGVSCADMSHRALWCLIDCIENNLQLLSSYLVYILNQAPLVSWEANNLDVNAQILAVVDDSMKIHCLISTQSLAKPRSEKLSSLIKCLDHKVGSEFETSDVIKHCTEGFRTTDLSELDKLMFFGYFPSNAVTDGL